MSPSPLRPPLGLLETVKQTDAVSTRAFPSSPPGSSLLPLDALPPACALSVASPVTPRPHVAPACEPRTQASTQANGLKQDEEDNGRPSLKESGTTRHLLPAGWWVWLAAVVGYQIPPRWAPNSTPLPARPCRRWAPLAPLLGPWAVSLGGGPCQCASGCEWGGTVPCTCGGHKSPGGSLFG